MSQENPADVAQSRVSAIVPMARREFVSTIVTGLGVGLVIAGLFYLFNSLVFTPVLCRAQSTTGCEQAPNYAMIIALVIGSIGGVAALARQRVYRPLLIVLAAALTLWSVQGVLANNAFEWYVAVPITGALFALGYAAFGWLSRIRNFILALIAIVILAVVTRLVFVG